MGYLLIIFLLPVTRLLGVLLQRDHRLKRDPQSILFIKLMGLGSLVLATDSIEAIRKKYPKANFVLLTETNIANGIKPFALFDESWCVDSKSFTGTLMNAFTFLFKSWRMKNAWVVDLEVYSKLTTVYSLLTVVNNRFGFYLSPVFFRKFLNTHNVHFNQYHLLEDNYWKMAEAVTNQSLVPAEKKIKRSGDYSKPFIAINNTCSELALVRKMKPNAMLAISSWILQNTSYKIALLGSSADFLENEKLVEKLDCNGRSINLAHLNDFEKYYEFLSDECAFIITIDSAPLHIAKKLGLPTISVWGPTNPASYLKIAEEEKSRHLYYYKQVSCSPCVHYFEKLPCNGNNFCMTEINADEVISKIKQLLTELNFSDRKETNAPVLIG